MRNFLALLGWNPGDERELFFTVEELIEAFSLDRVLRKAAVFDVTKLEWLNGQYIGRTPPDVLLPLIEGQLAGYGLDVAALGRDRVLDAVRVQSERARTTLELAQRVGVRFDAKLIERDPKANALLLKDIEGFRDALRAAIDRLSAVAPADWTEAHLERLLKDLASERGVKPGVIFQPVRVGVTGQTVSEPVNVLLVLVGREESLSRLSAALTWEPESA
jgi:glutamyl/glutaminyl-tRNA synthetase